MIARRWLYISSIIFSLGAFAKEKCSLQFTTKSCSAFNTTQEKITFHDGTYIINYRLVLDKKDQLLSSYNISDANSILSQKEQVLKLHIAAALDKIKKPNLSDEFKIMLANNLSKFMQVMGRTDRRTINLIWPPESTVNQNISLEDVKDGFENQLNFEERKGLYIIANSVDELFKNFKGLPEEIAKSWIAQTHHVSPAREHYVKELFSKVKALATNQIKKGRRPEELSFNEKESIKKVEAIQLMSRSEFADQCLSILPNASYDSQTNRIGLCLSQYNVPDAELVATIAHEFGHAVDPCNSQKRGVRFIQEKEYGLLSEVSAGIDFSEYIFKDIFLCLSSEKGGHFRLDPYAKGEAEAVCRSTSQINEAFADWFGTQILAKFIKGKKLNTDLEKLMLFGNRAAEACSHSTPDDDSHPQSENRIHNIILRNAAVAKALGCTTSAPECSQSIQYIKKPTEGSNQRKTAK